MNRFVDILDDLKRRRRNDDGFIVPKGDDRKAATQDEQAEQAMRLPYSSEPLPIDEPWSN